MSKGIKLKNAWGLIDELADEFTQGGDKDAEFDSNNKRNAKKDE